MIRPGPRLEHPQLGRVSLVRRLSGGGGWNETWLAERGGERLAVRFDTPSVRRLGLNRTGEGEVLRAIEGHGIGPQAVFSDPRRGVLVTCWLPGRALTPRDLRNPRLLRHLGAILRRLHETVVPPPDLALLDPARSACHYALLAGHVRAQRMAREASRCFKASAGHRRQAALCHNDPVAQNILRGRGLRLIDWEFAAPGDPLFDLAVILGHHGLGAEQGRTLLAAARGRVYPSDWRGLMHLTAGYRRLRVLWEAAVSAVSAMCRQASREGGPRLSFD